MYTIYTDGAYSSTRNQGGIGVVVYKDDKCILEYNKGFKNTTNNRMEISAVLYALKCVKKEIDSIEIVSDSQYVLGCLTKGWQRKKNTDLWELVDKELERVNLLCSNIIYSWEHGHQNCEGNNKADKLAVQASHFELDD